MFDFYFLRIKFIVLIAAKSTDFYEPIPSNIEKFTLEKEIKFKELEFASFSKPVPVLNEFIWIVLIQVPSCWKLIKPHTHDLLARVIFPLMCFQEEDMEMWQDDPIEWILCRSDIHTEYMSPEMAANYLLHTLCRKHPNLLPDILQFTLAPLITEAAKPNEKDGALHFLGKEFERIGRCVN